MKKLLSVLLAFLLLATIIPLGAFSVSAATSGTTGNCTWVLNGTALTISGNGAMEDYAYECGPWGSDITSLTIKSGVTYIGSFAFYECRYLSSVSIPSSVTSISAFAFEGCPLTSLTISEGVKYILDAAFDSCNLTSLTIPNSVIEIGDAAFGTVGALSIGSGLSYVKWHSAFSNVSSVNISSENKSFVSSNGVVFDKNKTTLIYCLRKKAGAYTVPNGVIAIEDFAFDGCSALTSITISSSVTSIGNYAFDRCSSLTAINVNTQNSAYSSADGVLFNKNKTTLIHCPTKKAGAYTIPDTVTSIKTRSFYGCSALTSITIPCSVTSIGSWAFYNCESLSDVYYSGTEADRETIAIGSGNDYLLNATWHYAPPKSLLYEIVNGEVTITGYTDELPADVIIPDTVEGYPVTAIGDNAFLECPLNSVIIPNSVTTIGSCAFSYSGLYEIFIPVGVTDIDPEAFHACDISFTVDENNRYYSAMDGILFNKDQTTIVACGTLRSYEYTVPDTVTTIGQFAFFGASIESLIIPVSVVSIEDYAFATARITDVYYGGTVTDRANIAVGSFNNDRLLNATWHYHYGQSHTYDHDFDADCNECGALREVNLPITFGGNSVSEDVSGLAFKFDVDVLGMAVISGTTAVYDNATIDGFRLIKMGALVSDSKSEIDIEAVYLCGLEADSASYAVRIINIPAENYDSVITAIPYFVVEIDGVVTTVYGEVQTTTFNNVKN